ncbi:MAG: DUF3302 domain-containing protein [Acidobacteriota bacterium]
MAMLIVLVLAWLPGIIAEQRDHRHAALVTVAGFASLWIHPALWLVVLLWAWKGPTKRVASR